MVEQNKKIFIYKIFMNLCKIFMNICFPFKFVKAANVENP